MVYYNKILRVWVIDPLDYFLLSCFIGSLIASQLKNYLSEKRAMERLKASIIEKSELTINSNRPISKNLRAKKVWKFALGNSNRGGQFVDIADLEMSNETFKLAQEIKKVIERLASFLKERELKGVAKIFFRNGRLLLELILYQCKIDITYSLLNEGLSTQVIVFTSTVGGTLGFTLSWFSVGATFVAPPTLISVLLLRSLVQQIANYREFSKLKKMINQLLEDNQLKQTLQATYIDGNKTLPRAPRIRMNEPGEIPVPEFNFDSEGQTLDNFIKAKMKDELGLIENPTPEQIQEIVNTPRRIKGKTVNFREFIDQFPKESDNIDIDFEDIVDAEILQEPQKIRLKNEEL